MTLRLKTLLYTGLTLLGLIIAIYLISSSIILNSFHKLEHEQSVQNVQRVINALNNEIEKINTILIDWSVWDDTYEFAKDRNKDYIRSNLVDESFLVNQLNLIAYLNIKGQVIYSKSYDLAKSEEITEHSGFHHQIKNHNILINHKNVQSNITGIILVNDAPMLITSHPIVRSNKQGPIIGTLIMGRFLDQNKIDDISKITNFPVEIKKISDIQDTTSPALTNTRIMIKTINSDKISGYAQIKDLYGSPILFLKVDIKRDIYRHGKASFYYFIGSLLIISIVFIILSLFLLKKLILDRLSKLSLNLNQITKSSDFTGRIETSGNDELTRVGNDINKMLSELDHSQKKLFNANQQLEIRVKERTNELQISNETLQKEVMVRKQTEQDIRESLDEKEVLLKEIHHRVKNNLQVISSLLYHQSQYTDDKTKDLFQESQDRVKSMSLIHENLYSLKNLSKINFKQYITSLTNHLKSTYSNYSNNSIEISIDIKNILLDIDTAIPCGLIINELVTNSLKHAFPNGNKGNIIVNMTAIDNSRHRLCVSDNGIGLPIDLDIENTKSLGLKLAKRLSEQLDGTFDIDYSNGTTFNIIF